MADKILSSMFDDDLDDLLSWKPSSSEPRDKGTNAKNVPAAKPKSKPFSKLDIDFDFEDNFEMPSFDIDFNFDPTPPEKKAPAPKNLDSSPKKSPKAPSQKDFDDGIDDIQFDVNR
ncbi:hypothetical protein R1sor_011418 [Riccia sorocarpa]|uniref:Uncharacterized protein n=1 Tax=Riccia sorocarpa TaxID=122646 RepID=A0ABD3I3J9_9MARC